MVWARCMPGGTRPSRGAEVDRSPVNGGNTLFTSEFPPKLGSALITWRRILTAVVLMTLCVPLIQSTATQAASVHNKVQELRDECEPVSWNAQFPGICNRRLDGTFGTRTSPAKFRAALPQGGSSHWWIRQHEITVVKGDTVAATNVGGIIHTSTASPNTARAASRNGTPPSPKPSTTVTSAGSWPPWCHRDRHPSRRH